MKPTFQLTYKSPTLLAVQCYGEEVLTFREGLYDLTHKFSNEQSELNEQAEYWLAHNHIGLMVCHIDARRHLIWTLNKTEYWQILLSAIRYGIVTEEFETTLGEVFDHADILRDAFLDRVQEYNLDDLSMDDAEQAMYDSEELYDKIVMLSDDEIAELTRTILVSFSQYCQINHADLEGAVPDATFAFMVIEPWARDFLWWPKYVNDHHRAIAGNTIFHARMAKGWTEEELAKRAGITPANVRNIERGRYDVKIDTLFAIAHALGISITIEADIQASATDK